MHGSLRTPVPSILNQSDLFFRLGKLVLADAAEGANPIFGDVFPGGAGSDAIVGITCCGIVNVTADFTYVLVHVRVSFR